MIAEKENRERDQRRAVIRHQIDRKIDEIKQLIAALSHIEMEENPKTCVRPEKFRRVS